MNPPHTHWVNKGSPPVIDVEGVSCELWFGRELGPLHRQALRRDR